ncbi:hypothetical protein [Aeromicrobium alkaliterrae]|uniref:MarR family transcriptional regulator n=1 Tax=Aeromicrobium alkaliterrae TaxID=302168 RepID=A0ABP4WCJ5_9ACTN
MSQKRDPRSTDPADAWRALASEIAGRGRMRVSRDGGRTYPRRYERTVTEQLPNQPAAVLIYDTAGAARTFCIDLDTSRGGRAAVAADLDAVTRLLEHSGARWFSDESPNGGVHVYVPLATPAPFPEASALARGLAATLPTMDPQPMLGIDSGCIRPPGGRHKTGGHQRLHGSLSAAYEATQTGTTDASWRRLVAEHAERPHSSPERATDAGHATVTQLRPRGRHNAPDDTYAAIARTGQYDPARYASPSEARQAVVWSAVAAGWDFKDLVVRVENGTWPGLAAMYGRYSRANRRAALTRDWHSAVAFEKRRRETTQVKPVRVGTTRGPKTHAGALYGYVRTWLNAVDLVFDQDRRDDLAARAVLYALAEAAQKTGSELIEFGNRSLAIATGLNQATVGKVLRRLLAEDDALIDLVEPAAGVRAHGYILKIPDNHVEAAHERPWRKGKITAVPAAFRELGLPATFAYAALRQVDSPISGRDLAHDARLGVQTTYDALEVLEAFGLARRTPAGYVLGPANLQLLAERFGVLEQIRDQLDRYRDERRAWWALLGIVRLVDHGQTLGRYGPAPPPPPDPDDAYTLLDMLEDQLGAHIIAFDPAATG